jgi:hypothetical protein
LPRLAGVDPAASTRKADMNLDTPAALTIEAWNKQKAALAKDKTLDDKFSKSAAKVTDAFKNLDKAHSAVHFSVLESKGVSTAAEAEAAIKELEAADKGDLKNLRGALKLAEAAADDFAAAVEKVRKTLQGASATVAVAAMAAAAAASKAGTAFEQSLDGAVDAAQREFKAILAKAKSQKPAAAGAPGVPGKLNKQQLLLKSRFITAMKLAKNPPPKLKLGFAIAVGKTTSLCFIAKNCGTTHEKMLRAMFPKEDPPRVYRPKDGHVIWEQKKLTFVTDAAVPPGVVKKVALTMKNVFKLPVGLRIRNTKGEAEEAEGEEIPDSALQGGDDPKAKAAAGKEFANKLKSMQADILEGLKGPAAAEVKELMASVKAHGSSQDFESAAEDLEDLEALLDNTPAAAVGASDEAAASGLSVRQLGTARLEWIQTRDMAIGEITRLRNAIAESFRGETAQLPQVREAVVRLEHLKAMLKTDLDDRLDKALSENDPARRAQLATAAKASLAHLRSVLKEDKLMQHLDANEILPDMHVVAPMQARLSAIEAALG